MDIPTRTGLGGSALFTVAGFSQPLFGWWVAGPAMGLSAAVAVWGFWPLMSNFEWPFSRKVVPLHEAATRAYEAAEKAGILHLIASPTDSPEKQLTHIKLRFMVDDDAELFGVKPPSTVSRLIPKAELQGHDAYPAEGATSDINHMFATDGVAYTNVMVRRKDLRRVINGYLAEAKQISK